MRIPFQTALDFHASQAEDAFTHGIPIDKSFPEDAANRLAALETYNKHLYRPNTYLHKWWARRSGTTFRYILKQLVENPGKRDFYEGGGLESKIILDPMMGGGTTLHEAIRMGANVIGVDIDPIPVLQAKASLKQSSLEHKKNVFNHFVKALKNRLALFFKTACPACDRESEVQFTLYGLRRKCSCREVVFIDSLVLRKDNDHDVRICPMCQEVYTAETHTCLEKSNTHLVVKGTRGCEKCETAFVDILGEPFSERYVPLVIAGMCPEHGAFFKSADNDDQGLLNLALINAQKLKFGDSEGFCVNKVQSTTTSFGGVSTTFRTCLLHGNFSIFALHWTFCWNCRMRSACGWPYYFLLHWNLIPSCAVIREAISAVQERFVTYFLITPTHFLIRLWKTIRYFPGIRRAH